MRGVARAQSLSSFALAGKTGLRKALLLGTFCFGICVFLTNWMKGCSFRSRAPARKCSSQDRPGPPLLQALHGKGLSARSGPPGGACVPSGSLCTRASVLPVLLFISRVLRVKPSTCGVIFDGHRPPSPSPTVGDFFASGICPIAEFHTTFFQCCTLVTVEISRSFGLQASSCWCGKSIPSYVLASAGIPSTHC